MNNDIFAASRPITNEKPEFDPNDIFAASRPEAVKNQFKQPIENSMFKGTEDLMDWTERGDQFSGDTPVLFNQPKQRPISSPRPNFENPALKGSDEILDWTERGDRFDVSSPILSQSPQELLQSGKALASGATFGASETFPGMAVDEENNPEVSALYKTIGSFSPISRLNMFFNNPLTKLAAKSPYLKGSLNALAEMTGWGLTGISDKILTDSFKGEIPDFEKVLEHGADWMAFDAVLKSLGATGKFAKWLLGYSKSTKEPSWKVVNDIFTDMKQKGIDISDKDRATAYVLSQFENNFANLAKESKPIKLSQKPAASVTEQLAQEKLGMKPEVAMEYPFGPRSDIVKIPKETPKNIQLSKKSEPTPLETKAKEILPKNQVSNIDLKNKKIEKLEYEKISRNSQNLSEPYQPNEIDAQSAINKLGENRTSSLIEQVGERAINKKSLGETIKSDIESGIKTAKETYEPLYQSVKEGAKSIKHKPSSTIDLAESILKNLNTLQVKPEGYKKVISTINDALSDMGLKIHDFGDVHGFLDANGNKLNIKNLRLNDDVSLDKTIELAKRLNEIINYDIIEPSIKDVLKPIVGSLKEEIKSVLKKESPNLFKNYLNAETNFAKSADKFRNKIIKNIRGSDKLEKVADTLLETSVLENIKKTVSPEKFKQVEREVVENLKDMSFEQANKSYREIAHLLDKKAQDAARSIIASKSPYGKVLTPSKIHESIISDLNKAFTTETRPSNVLELWKTIKGQKLINEALEGTPNKKEILKYLQEQSFYDFTKSVVDKSGKIDFKKFNEYLKDPATIVNLRLIGGNEAVKFFNQLEQMSNILKFNVSTLEKLPTVKLNPSKGTYALGEETLLRSAEKAKEPYKKALEIKSKIPSLKTEGLEYGKEKLKLAGERAKTPPKEVGLFKEIFPKKTSPASNQRGKGKLEAAAKKREPVQFKLKELSEKYKINPTVKGMLYMLGLMTATKATVAASGARILYQIASKPSSRSKFRILLNNSKPVKNKPFNVVPFMKTLQSLSDDVD